MSEPSTYLTTEEARDYLRFPTVAALRMWAHRHNVPRLKRGRTVLFLRRDLDDVVQGRFNVQAHVARRFGRQRRPA